MKKKIKKTFLDILFEPEEDEQEDDDTFELNSGSIVEVTGGLPIS